ncbi:hypothetical protein GWK47_027492 [Chionoecetes opilio]|uniref:Uncharacterized protein n=1 Tax=Chionoecetes opilio TaxID=41210 RepID=A0A8J8WCD1_CHIOP|nr:hypothetical protein GWK47_027492 [Chionoecetes opilio]
MAVRCKHHTLPLPLSTATRLISRVCRFTWDTSLGKALRATTMSHYRSDSSPHPWIRDTFRFLDVSLTRLRAAAGPLHKTHGPPDDEAEKADHRQLEKGVDCCGHQKVHILKDGEEPCFETLGLLPLRQFSRRFFNNDRAYLNGLAFNARRLSQMRRCGEVTVFCASVKEVCDTASMPTKLWSPSSAPVSCSKSPFTNKNVLINKAAGPLVSDATRYHVYILSVMPHATVCTSCRL